MTSNTVPHQLLQKAIPKMLFENTKDNKLPNLFSLSNTGDMQQITSVLYSDSSTVSAVITIFCTFVSTYRGKYILYKDTRLTVQNLSENTYT